MSADPVLVFSCVGTAGELPDDACPHLWMPEEGTGEGTLDDA